MGPVFLRLTIKKSSLIINKVKLKNDNSDFSKLGSGNND
jgi:hypothetical protein